MTRPSSVQPFGLMSSTGTPSITASVTVAPSWSRTALFGASSAFSCAACSAVHPARSSGAGPLSCLSPADCRNSTTAFASGEIVSGSGTVSAAMAMPDDRRSESRKNRVAWATLAMFGMCGPRHKLEAIYQPWTSQCTTPPALPRPAPGCRLQGIGDQKGAGTG